MKTNRRKIWWLAFSFLIGVGTYNAVVINTHSRLSSEDTHFIKRLDEMYGNVIPARTRKVATNKNWKKLDETELEATTHTQILLASAEHTPEEAKLEAAIQEQLTLDLVEVTNPKKWKQGLTTVDFEGNLSTSNGILEDFNVSFPSGEEISVAYMEMNGNEFKYDLEGEVYSALIFAADPHSYVVTLSNGPLEGTTMRFKKGPTEEQLLISQTLQQDHDIQVGSFGEDTVTTQQSAALSPEAELPVDVHSFNFDPQVL